MKQTRVVKENYESITGHLFYYGESLAYKSTLERDFLIYQTFREGVADITPQPIKVPFKKNGCTYEYTPDFFVHLRYGYGKPMIVEVKPKSEWQANWRDWSDKWKATMIYCKEQDFRFAIYDEDRIYHQAFYNIQFLLKYKNLYVAKEELEAILNDIKNRNTTTVDYILERYFKGEIYKLKGQKVIWHLMSNKLIGFDLWDDVKSETAEIWYAEKQ